MSAANENDFPVRLGRKIQGDENTSEVWPSFSTLYEMEEDAEVSGRFARNKNLIVCPHCGLPLWITRDETTFRTYRCTNCDSLCY